MRRDDEETRTKVRKVGNVGSRQIGEGNLPASGAKASGRITLSRGKARKWERAQYAGSLLPLSGTRTFRP